MRAFNPIDSITDTTLNVKVRKWRWPVTGLDIRSPILIRQFYLSAYWSFNDEVPHTVLFCYELHVTIPLFVNTYYTRYVIYNYVTKIYEMNDKMAHTNDRQDKIR